MIEHLYASAEVAGWAKPTVARHTSGRVTFRCSGVTAVFGDKSASKWGNDVIRLYTPKLFERSVPDDRYRVQHTTKLVEGFIGLKVYSDRGLF